MPHGRMWKWRESLLIDPSAGGRYNSIPHVRWSHVQESQPKTAYNYFTLLNPMCGLDSMLQCTNNNMNANGLSHLDKGEFLKFLGLRLAMACEPKRGPIHVYWITGSEPGSVFKGADFGHYGMTRHRFQDILKCLSFVPPHVEGTCTDVSNYTKLYRMLIACNVFRIHGIASDASLMISTLHEKSISFLDVT